MSGIELTTPDWDLEIGSGDQVAYSTVHEGEVSRDDGAVGEGAQISVSGIVSKASYIYLVQIATDGRVVVLYPAGDESDHEEPGASLRLPTSGNFVTPLVGIIRVVEASEIVARADWPKLLQGRDPQAEPITLKSSVPT